MKKLLIIGLLALGVTAQAQKFVSSRLIAPAGILLYTNSATGLSGNNIGLTNLLSFSYAPTNRATLIVSNFDTSTITNIGTGTAADTVNFCLDAELPTPFIGTWPPGPLLTGVTNTTGTSYPLGGANIFVQLYGTNAAAAGVVQFVITGLPNGKTESTVSGDDFVFGVTANGVTPVKFSTNIPAGKWLGFGKLRLRSVLNTYGAQSDGTNGAVWLQEVSFNRFVP